jgi:microcin C transport system permease protein
VERDPAEPTQPGIVTPPPHPGPGGHAPPPVVPAGRRPWLSPLNQRRWRNFKKNRRAYWSLWIFAVLFGLSLFAEFIANDKPILVRFQGEFWYSRSSSSTPRPPSAATSGPRPSTATSRCDA